MDNIKTEITCFDCKELIIYPDGSNICGCFASPTFTPEDRDYKICKQYNNGHPKKY